MDQYEPVFGVECSVCDTDPCVGVRTDEGSLRCSGLCGSHFFNDRMMVDWEKWNDQQEATE